MLSNGWSRSLLRHVNSGADHVMHVILLHDSLQLPRVPKRVLDDHAAARHDIPLRYHVLFLLLRKVYPAVLRYPAT